MSYRVYLSVAVLFFLPAIAAADPSGLSPKMAEEVAVETALSQGFVNREDQSTGFEGIYHGRRGSCDLVTVRITHPPEADRDGRTDLFTYQICNGRIGGTGGYARTDFGIPDGMDEFARNIAVQAEKKGSAAGDYRGFKVLGRAVHSQEKCSVEVRILWDGRLYDQIISECTFLKESVETASAAFSF